MLIQKIKSFFKNSHLGQDSSVSSEASVRGDARDQSDNIRSNKTRFKGTWPQAIKAFLLPIFLILILRWAILEPFVIPTGSMIPSLLIHDHLLVKKFEFGVKWPFSNQWIFIWKKPYRGQIVVFRYPENPKIFYIKRLIGLPGDIIEVGRRRLKINGQDVTQIPAPLAHSSALGDEIDSYDYFLETVDQISHQIRYHHGEQGNEEILRTIKIPDHSYFMMGDNRDESSDSRSWGFVPEENLVGSPWIILMGCSESLPNSSLCSPQHLNLSRILKFP